MLCLQSTNFMFFILKIPIISAIQDQLRKVSNQLTDVKSMKLTAKEKRIHAKQREGLAAVEQIVEERKSQKPQGTTSEFS